ncbi:MAG: aminoglycoside phosphotransferase family protein [Ruminococcaceae bacterium]|nr:aminoglycoside phosphotransferase family protein [Oscillospiraceae bacterium]
MTEQALLSLFRTLMREFRLKGELEDYRVVKVGNINDTYFIGTRTEEGKRKDYTVQRLNHKVFQNPVQVAENAFAVTSHMERKLLAVGQTDIRRKVLHVYRKEGGEFFHRSEEGDYWRVLSYVYDSRCVNHADEEILYGTGYAFGEFQRNLSDFPAHTLHHTIPDFHNTPKRFADLRTSGERDVCGRREEVEEELAYLLSMEGYVSLLEDLHGEGKLPLRVVHNDTKCNNVMFDAETRTPLAVIDLDTVMPGYVAHDFGDAVRFACNTASEDEEDLSLVSLNLRGYQRLAEGFVRPLLGIITESEFNTLPDGVLIITLELAARFLKDYLDGDVYFKCRKDRHNLIRARCQIALAKDIAAKLEEMRTLLKSLSVQK